MVLLSRCGQWWKYGHLQLWGIFTMKINLQITETLHCILEERLLPMFSCTTAHCVHLCHRRSSAVIKTWQKMAWPSQFSNGGIRQKVWAKLDQPFRKGLQNRHLAKNYYFIVSNWCKTCWTHLLVYYASEEVSISNRKSTRIQIPKIKKCCFIWKHCWSQTLVSTYSFWNVPPDE